MRPRRNNATLVAAIAPPDDGWTDERAELTARSLMDAEAQSRAVAHRSSPHAERALFGRLASNKSIVLGIFGASVAQNAGCLDQGNRRCMKYNGAKPIFVPWGSPPVRKFKGWAVRLLEHINQSYPNHGHRINNSGLDATPAAVAVYVVTCRNMHPVPCDAP